LSSQTKTGERRPRPKKTGETDTQGGIKKKEDIAGHSRPSKYTARSWEAKDKSHDTAETGIAKKEPGTICTVTTASGKEEIFVRRF